MQVRTITINFISLGYCTIVVPKFVAEWIEWNKQMGVSLKNMLKCYADFYGGEEPDVSSEGLKAVHWYVDNPYKFIQSYENGYTIEPEQLYYIPLRDLETSDGIQQVLSKRDTYFASRPNEKLKQRFTKDEIAQVPEVYKPYEKPIEEEEEGILINYFKPVLNTQNRKETIHSVNSQVHIQNFVGSILNDSFIYLK